MQMLGSVGLTKPRLYTSVRPTALFLLAASLLTLMSIVLEPGLGLPLLAFIAMAALTRLLGLRLYQELTGVTDQAD
jgi:hypothetical protein